MQMVNTIYGAMPVNKLKKKETRIESRDKIIKTLEYWLGDVMVHRSVHAHLKQNVFATAFSHSFT